MSPEPMRKQKINEQAFMIYTARFLAELKGMDLTHLAEVVTTTSKQLFKLT
jgi:Tat protein secretion system quality control protein TatD with DNase activity